MDMINWLKDARKYEHPTLGAIYCGPAPFTVNRYSRSDMDALMKRPWVISHTAAAGKLWRATRLGAFAIPTIKAGDEIELMVEEWPTPNEPAP